MDKRHQLIVVLVILIAIGLVIFTAARRLDEEVTVTPLSDAQTVINTQELPNHVFKASDSHESLLPVHVIAPGTYMFFGNVAQLDTENRGANGNAGFVITPEGVVVIDALGTPRLGQRLISTIRSITDIPITHLIITHNHPDHAYGAIAFARLGGVTIIGHIGVLDYLATQTFESSVQYRQKLLPEDMAGFEFPRPDILINGERFSSQTLTVGERRFVIYNTGRHHSYGDLVVHQVEDNIVWISDLAFNQRLTYMGDGNSQQIIDSENWLLEKFADAVLMVPGHGSAQTAPFPMVTKTRDYVERLREAMAQAVEKGVGMQDAVEQVDFPDWQNTRLYEENHRRNAHFVYREMEQALF